MKSVKREGLIRFLKSKIYLWNCKKCTYIFELFYIYGGYIQLTAQRHFTAFKIKGRTLTRKVLTVILPSIKGYWYFPLVSN